MINTNSLKYCNNTLSFSNVGVKTSNKTGFSFCTNIDSNPFSNVASLLAS